MSWTTPLLVRHEQEGPAEQWRLVVHDQHGTELCSKVYATPEAAGAAQRDLAELLEGLADELLLRALDFWMTEKRERYAGAREVKR